MKLLNVRKRYLGYILVVMIFFGTISSVVAYSVISERSPVLECQEWGFYRSKGQRYYTYPEKIVVQPWRGQHHVYAIFNVPNEYINDKQFTLNISDNDTFCGILKYEGTGSIDNVSPKPGHYLMKGFINTRQALGIIIQGKGDELKQPSNWRMGYVKKDEKL